MKRLSQAADAFFSAYATAHPIRTAIAIGLAMGGATTVFDVVTGHGLAGALLFGCLIGGCGFLGARIGAWLVEDGFADQPSLDPGQSEHLTELTYAATSPPDDALMPPH
jgi:hypothetical protein